MKDVQLSLPFQGFPRHVTAQPRSPLFALCLASPHLHLQGDALELGAVQGSASGHGFTVGLVGSSWDRGPWESASATGMDVTILRGKTTWENPWFLACVFFLMGWDHSFGGTKKSWAHGGKQGEKVRFF